MSKKPNHTTIQAMREVEELIRARRQPIKHFKTTSELLRTVLAVATLAMQILIAAHIFWR